MGGVSDESACSQTTCPTCATSFPAESDGDSAYAQHVAGCTTSSSSSSSTSTAPVASVSQTEVVIGDAREIAAAATATSAASASASGAADVPGSEDVDMEAAAVTPSKVTLFPSQCALCGSGGRLLLHCSGSCARVFHAACVDDMQPGGSTRSVASTTGFQSQWTCAECARGVHACQLCGFLGHESNTMRKCALVDCGFFFHTNCLQASQPQAQDTASEFVCPRHTCSKCGAVEKDMRKCVSCTKCFAASHLKCPDDGPEAKQSGSNQSSASVQDAVLLHICGKHASATSTIANASIRSGKPGAIPEEQLLALKHRVQQGDIVLILELTNAILPPSAKNAAPDVINQWGVVIRAETIDVHNQLLSISIFSDGSVIAVPNRYVLSLANANAFPSPQIMLRDCIKWHAVNELNLRHAELDALASDYSAKKKEAKRDDILNASCTAFYARAEKLSLSISQLFTAAKAGYIFWETHREELKQLEGSGAPIYVFMNTRLVPESLLTELGEARGVSRDVGDGIPGGDVVMKKNASIHNAEDRKSDNANDSSSAPPSSVANAPLPAQPSGSPSAPQPAVSDLGVDQEDSSATQDETTAADANMEDAINVSDAGFKSDNANSDASAAIKSSGLLGTIQFGKPAPSDALNDAVSSAKQAAGVAVEVIKNKQLKESKSKEGVREAAEASALAAPHQEERHKEEKASLVSANLHIVTSESPPEENNTKALEPTVDVTESVVVSAPVKEVNENELTSGAMSLGDLKKPQSVSVSSLETMSVNTVEVSIVLQADGESSKAVVKNKQKEGDGDGGGDNKSELQAAKRQKLSHETQQTPTQPQQQQKGLELAKVPPPFVFSTAAPTTIKPLPPSSNTFAREKESYTAILVTMNHQQTRKRRVLAEYSPQMLQELKHQAAVFLEEETNPSPHTRRRKSSNPKHCDAFPFATAPESFRPPFFRPSVVFSRAQGRRMEGLSRILLSQDKRNIKCFIQGSDENRCLHQPSIANGGSGPGSHMAARSEDSFVTIDLMSVDNFKALEMVIRTRMIAAVEQNDGYLQEIFEDHADRARRLFAEKKNRGLMMDLYYCSYDGSREKVARETDDWLCFCANVCHLTAVILLQGDTLGSVGATGGEAAE